MGCVGTTWINNLGCVETIWINKPGCVGTIWINVVRRVETIWDSNMGCVGTIWLSKLGCVGTIWISKLGHVGSIWLNKMGHVGTILINKLGYVGTIWVNKTGHVGTIWINKMGHVRTSHLVPLFGKVHGLRQGSLGAGSTVRAAHAISVLSPVCVVRQLNKQAPSLLQSCRAFSHFGLSWKRPSRVRSISLGSWTDAKRRLQGQDRSLGPSRVRSISLGSWTHDQRRLHGQGGSLGTVSAERIILRPFQPFLKAWTGQWAVCTLWTGFVSVLLSRQAAWSFGVDDFNVNLPGCGGVSGAVSSFRRLSSWFWQLRL